MKENVHDMELIERFLEDQLTEDEKRAFEARKQNDKDFKTLVSDMDLLLEGIKQSARKTSKQEKLERLKFFSEVVDMETEEENSEGEKGKVVPLYRKRSILAIAASIALLISLSAYFTRDQVPLNERIYAAYFEPFDSPGTGLTRSSSNTTEGLSLKAQAYLAYDNANYTEAVSLFNKILSEKDDPIIHLCLGNAQLKLGEYDEAEATFNQMLNEHTDLVTQTRWYLALTYLRENKMERAKSILWEVSEGSTYGEKARKILKDLD